MRSLRIAIVVQGRFHAFDLARSLTASGHRVTVFTNYPGWAAARFGVDPSTVKTAWIHGVMSRTWAPGEAWMHEAFGRWAARELEGEDWDIVHCWSGVSEELLTSPRVRARCRMLMRGSAHITVQHRLLAEEAARTGLDIDRPSRWMIEREQREYERSDRVVVLSTFARDTFLAEGVPAERLLLLPLGVDVRAFAPGAAAVEARQRRILDGQPLRVLYTGTLSARKGLLDLVDISRRLADQPFEFRLVGPATVESAALLAGAGPNVRRFDKVPQADLPAVYRDADLFLFPTIEDGFGMVLTQAQAAGLPILASANSAAPDIMSEGHDGWIVPARSPEAFVDRLHWCHQHRPELASMASRSGKSTTPRDWAAVATQFASLAHNYLTTASPLECRA